VTIPKGDPKILTMQDLLLQKRTRDRSCSGYVKVLDILRANDLDLNENLFTRYS